MTRAVLAALLVLSPLVAQSVVSARAGTIYTVQGTVTIDGRPVLIDPKIGSPQLQPGQVLASMRGHAEIFLGPDAILWTGNDTQLRLDDANVEAARVSLLAGAAIIEIKHARAGRSISIDLGGKANIVTAAGVYRFERTPDRMLVSPRDKDDLHYFAAYRSLALESEAGRYDRWKYVRNGVYTREQRKGRSREPLKTTIVAGDFKHPGFDLEMSLPISSARAKYIVASVAGLLNDDEGLLSTGPNTIDSGDQRIEIFLGLGITARLNHDSRLTLLDTMATAPIVALEKGEVLIEVAKSAENTHLILHLGNNITELHKPGLYRYDMSSSSPLHAVPLTNAKQPDAFFLWTRQRSLDVWLGDLSFMADWQRLVAPDQVRHKQFGDANLGRSVPVQLPAQLPVIPSASNRPIGAMPGR